MPIIMLSNMASTANESSAALLDLDKGLRSDKVGMQMEAIVRFPQVLEKYPFPVLVNSAFIKLADMFRVGTNLHRLHILHVTERSHEHLEKISSIDEIVRKIFVVSVANDPTSRAIFLRMAGSLASVISQRSVIHHAILTALDSDNNVELTAAMFATQCFCKHSSAFALVAAKKIAAMISVVSDAGINVKLLSILCNVHHNIEASQIAKEVCEQLLHSFHTHEVFGAALHTLTSLAVANRTDIDEQLNLLMEYLIEDDRILIKAVCLKNLCVLAKEALHCWAPHHVNKLYQFGGSIQSVGLLQLTLSVLIPLSSKGMDRMYKSKIFDWCIDKDETVSSKACQLITSIVCERGDVITEEDARFSLSLCAELTPKWKSQIAIKRVLASVTCLADRQLVDMLVNMLEDGDNGELVKISACDTLASVAGRKDGDFLLRPFVNPLVACLQQQDFSKQQTLINKLCTVLLQIGSATGKNSNSIVQVAIKCDAWVAYRIVRQAFRYGDFKVAESIISCCWLDRNVCENFLYWLESLHEFSKAENAFQHRNWYEAINMYHIGSDMLRAAVTPQHALSFHCAYVELRVSMLQLFADAIHGLHSLQYLSGDSDSLQDALAPLQKQSRECIDSHHTLYGKCFNADKATLAIIRANLNVCKMVQIALAVCSVREEQKLSIIQQYNEHSLDGIPIEVDRIIKCCEKAKIALMTLVEQCEESGQFVGGVINVVENLACGLPFSFPRYFFQTLQDTSINLVVSPHPRVPGEAITVDTETMVNVHVEGVIMQKQSSTFHRVIRTVIVTVTSNIQNRSVVLDKVSSSELHIEKTVQPSHDYFRAEFLLPFPLVGIHLVTIKLSAVDEDGQVWQTGPQTSLTIKSLTITNIKSLKIKQTS